MKECRLCPRNCGADRNFAAGFCGCGPQIKLARAALHLGEEPCLIGQKGSGAVFFSGCPLQCCFCQNQEISMHKMGFEISPQTLGEIFLSLQEQGAANLNLITGTQYLPGILNALERVKHKLFIPILWNTGGYETVETLQRLDGMIDIYLQDIKYAQKDRAARYAHAPDYFEIAKAATMEMLRQTGHLVFKGDQLQKGVILRHLVLPGGKRDSLAILRWISGLDTNAFLFSLMRQYTPCGNLDQTPELKRKVSDREYEAIVQAAIDLGLENGFVQEKESASAAYIPAFDGTGVKGFL